MRVDALVRYREGIKDAAQVLAERAEELCKGNLLSAKMSLWRAISIVEEKYKEMKNEVGEEVRENGTPERTEVRSRKRNKKHNKVQRSRH